jgi:hypothetical protein
LLQPVGDIGQSERGFIHQQLNQMHQIARLRASKANKMKEASRLV